MRSLLISLFYICFLLPILSGQSKIEITGRVTDTLGQGLDVATVLILDAADSSYIGFTQSDRNGDFYIKERIDKSFLVRLTYIGYISEERRFDANGQSIIKLGTIALSPINNVLFEVVVKEAKAPLRMRGDTLEYDATTFKVPQGSSVEDLLRKLPGIDVDGAGKIFSQGQEVDKLTVDGKRFFGDDPTMATKNLPAESISKVQVFNEKTEQELLTGVSKEKDTKTMNLELKDDFKKGGFGKILAGGGLEEKSSSINGNTLGTLDEYKGNYNKFNKKSQFSLIGVYNTTGRNGMNWNDQQDFQGQQNWEWSESEELFGFGRNYRIYNLGDGSSDEFGNTEYFFGDGSSGRPKNGIFGVNYNYDHNRLKISSMYAYRLNDLYSSATRKRQFYLPDNSYITNDESDQQRENENHKIELILEKAFDSSNVIIVKFRANNAFTETSNLADYKNSDVYEVPTSEASISRTADRDNVGLQGVAYYKHKFKNKRRSFGVNAVYTDNANDITESLINKGEFYQYDSTYYLHQNIQFATDIKNLKSSVLYVEPLNKDFALQFFYNYVQRRESLVRDVFDRYPDSLYNIQLSRNNTHDILFNKIGSILQFGKQGHNISAGLAGQRIRQEGVFNSIGTAIPSIDQTYDNVVGIIDMNFTLPKSMRLGLSYENNVKEPSFKNLSPLIDNTNPLFIQMGNPQLDPEQTHRVSMNLNGNNRIKFINYNMNLSYTYFTNEHIFEQTIDTFNITTSQPINFSGGNRFQLNAGSGFPFIKNVFTARVNGNSSIYLSNSIINKVLNEAKIYNHGLNVSLSFTPSDKYSIYLDSRVSYNTTDYSINNSQNFDVWSQTYNLQTNAKLFWGIYSNANFDYKIINNNRFGTQYNIPLLNASIYKLFLKENKLEVRISAYDILNENVNIRSFVNATQVSETQSSILARYLLLTVTYNIKGIQANVKKADNFWF